MQLQAQSETLLFSLMRDSLTKRTKEAQAALNDQGLRAVAAHAVRVAAHIAVVQAVSRAPQIPHVGFCMHALSIVCQWHFIDRALLIALSQHNRSLVSVSRK